MTKQERRRRCVIRAISKAGGVTALARRLKDDDGQFLTPQRVMMWKRRGKIPWEFVERVAVICDLMPNQVDPYCPVVVIEDAPYEGEPAQDTGDFDATPVETVVSNPPRKASDGVEAALPSFVEIGGYDEYDE